MTINDYLIQQLGKNHMQTVDYSLDFNDDGQRDKLVCGAKRWVSSADFEGMKCYLFVQQLSQGSGLQVHYFDVGRVVGDVSCIIWRPPLLVMEFAVHQWSEHASYQWQAEYSTPNAVIKPLQNDATMVTNAKKQADEQGYFSLCVD